MRSTITVLAAVVLAASLSACSPAGPAHPSAAAWSALRLLARQPPGPARAEAQAVRGCLREHGFDAPPPLPDFAGVENLPIPIDESGRNGYGDRIPRGPDQVTDRIARYAATLPESRRVSLATALDDDTSKAWFTTPDGRRVGASRTGCLASARTAVYGSVHNWLVIYYLPQDLNDEAADAYRDRPVQRASKAYLDCMAAAGYAARYPQDAERLARMWGAGTVQPDRASGGEARLATADARCRDGSRLTEAIDASFEGRSGGWLARHENAVQQAADILRAADRGPDLAKVVPSHRYVDGSSEPQPARGTRPDK